MVYGTLIDINTNIFSVPNGRYCSWPNIIYHLYSRLLHLNINADVLCYEVDTVILVKNKDYNELIKESNICLDWIKNWWSNNNLQLNLSKFKYVILKLYKYVK